MNRRTFRPAALAVSAALVLQGCAAPGARSGGGGTASGNAPQSVQQVCSPAVVGIGAALLCAALASGNNRVRTGAACAAVAVVGCYLANSYNAEKTRSAQEVQDEYLRQNRQLPERATVTAYKSEVNPRGAVARGQEVKIVSTIVAVPGRSDRGIAIEEELGIVDARGELWGKPVRKPANPGNEAGQFQTSFTVPVHDGMSQGTYALRRSLFVNGAPVLKDDMSARFQVVSIDGGAVVAVLEPPALTR